MKIDEVKLASTRQQSNVSYGTVGSTLPVPLLACGQVTGYSRLRATQGCYKRAAHLIYSPALMMVVSKNIISVHLRQWLRVSPLACFKHYRLHRE